MRPSLCAEVLCPAIPGSKPSRDLGALDAEICGHLAACGLEPKERSRLVSSATLLPRLDSPRPTRSLHRSASQPPRPLTRLGRLVALFAASAACVSGGNASPRCPAPRVTSLASPRLQPRPFPLRSRSAPPIPLRFAFRWALLAGVTSDSSCGSSRISSRLASSRVRCPQPLLGHHRVVPPHPLTPPGSELRVEAVALSHKPQRSTPWTKTHELMGRQGCCSRPQPRPSPTCASADARSAEVPTHR